MRWPLRLTACLCLIGWSQTIAAEVRQPFLKSDAGPAPLVEADGRDSGGPAGLTNSHLLPAKSDPFSGPSVRGLLCARGPSAVAWLVVPIVVDSLDRELWWARPHVGQEVLVGSPTLAERDASGSVVGERLRLWIEASLLDRSPRHVLAWFGLVALPGSTVCDGVGSGEFIPETTATSLTRGREISSAHIDDCAAVAAAFPVTRNASND